MMKAAQIHDYGQADKVVINDVDTPTINDNQVLVEAYAASLNPFDSMVREGYLKDRVPLQMPTTLGGDFAGIVKEVGANVAHLKVGDKIYGQALSIAGSSGALAEYIAADSSQSAIMPQGVSFEEAASLVLVGNSALQALEQSINLESGQKILIHGGSGGIGTIAIQIAKHKGAYATTTASGEGVAYAKQLGADEVIDYKSQAFEDLVHNYDAVFDTVGGDAYERSFQVLKRGGVISSMIAQPNQKLADQYGVHVVYEQTSITTEWLGKLSKLIEDGIVTPHIGKTFSLSQTKEAFEARENTSTVGKIVLKIK